MKKSDFIYNEDGTAMNPYYKEADDARRAALDALAEILFDVQYAKSGDKTAARRDAAIQILESIETAYKRHKTK